VSSSPTTPADPAGKVLARDALLRRFGRPRDHRLVFTNGCFDLLHPGHVLYLHRARLLGDALVVGLNSDASVHRLKGPERPFVDEASRALVLAGLASVDAVTPFDEDTPAELIAALLPDVLVKGGDYAPDAVVGRDAVRAAGGVVRIVPFVEGHSTTGLVDRIRIGSARAPSTSPSSEDAGPGRPSPRGRGSGDGGEAT
jgi:D-beta-D-heptose 7-phosphate kinase/D-beta-D-heptose 1-phosphate adenosyltransferase